MTRAHKCYHPGVYPILSRDYQFNYNQYATVLILSTCISPLSYMKDNVGFSFFYEAYGLLFNEQKYPKVGFFLKRFLVFGVCQISACYYLVRDYQIFYFGGPEISLATLQFYS